MVPRTCDIWLSEPMLQAHLCMSQHAASKGTSHSKSSKDSSRRTQASETESARRRTLLDDAPLTKHVQQKKHPNWLEEDDGQQTSPAQKRRTEMIPPRVTPPGKLVPEPQPEEEQLDWGFSSSDEEMFDAPEHQTEHPDELVIPGRVTPAAKLAAAEQMKRDAQLSSPLPYIAPPLVSNKAAQQAAKQKAAAQQAAREKSAAAAKVAEAQEAAQHAAFQEAAQRAAQITSAPRQDPAAVLSDTEGLTSIFKGSIAGANANIMLDTGSSANCISEHFCKLMKIKIQPIEQVEMATATGTTEQVVGSTTVVVAIQGYRSKLRLLVIPMVPDCDAILGEPWHRSTKAVKQYGPAGLGTVRLYKGRTMRKLIQHVNVAQQANSPRAKKAGLLSYTQFRRVRKLRPYFVAHVQTAPQKGGEKATSDQKPSEQLSVEQPSLASDHNTTVNQKKLEQLLGEFNIVFEPLPKKLPPFRDTAGHTIPLQEGAKPPYRAPYRLSPLELREVKKQIQELLENKFIQPSRSPYGSPVLFVQKKDGTLRMCIDYRALNKITIHDKYPLPRTDELLDKAKGASIFSSLDLTSGYHQIRIHPDDVPKTAFTAAGEHYEFKVLPFGLTNAPSTFQRCLNSLFKHLPFVAVYLDDILIFSKTAEEHLAHLRQVLQILKDNELYCKLKKCEFNQTELRFVGHIVGAKGIRPDPEKLSAVTDWPIPHDIHELRKFLGFTNYFRKFLQGYSQRTAALTHLLRKNVAYEWTQACQESFDQLKIDLTTALILISPDTTQPYELIADACGTGIGAVSLQHEKPIAFESRKFNSAEQNYTVTEQELLAIIHGLSTWRYLLEGLEKDKLKLVTDHSPLTFMPTAQSMSRRQVRWSELLQRFPCTWEHRAGKNNVADPISTRPGQTKTIPISVVTRGSTKPVVVTPFQDEIIAGYELLHTVAIWVQQTLSVISPDITGGLISKQM